MDRKTNRSKENSSSVKYRKCPMCGNKINYLVGHSEAIYFVEFDSKSNDLRRQEASDSQEERAFECPSCGNELFDDEESVLEFLKNGKLPENYKSSQ